MTHRADVARGRDVVARWCNLAEQRLEYLTVLFETGRWRRYHSERAFLENIQEAKAAVETWRDLCSREASSDNSAVDMSWLGRSSTVPHRGEAERDHSHRPQPQPIQIAAAAAPQVLALSPAAKHVSSEEAPSAADADPAELPAAAEMVLDLAAIERRYPLLRNAL